ncbi:hypothetical protein KGF54_000542 [Candida jiufengensis]|uniref:uncharacterized protein n=1 Tax=Candida jiufengensis TaxID=497108 RepID=UPI002224746B|nr:uncharacterized protein KGF54_000542 [Candida jiufengensis]KAI5956923.1 hypothetical protein KGF54_000542 [Candida jiufengensis]
MLTEEKSKLLDFEAYQNLLNKQINEKYLKPTIPNVLLHMKERFANVKEIEMDLSFETFKKIPQNLAKLCNLKVISIIIKKNEQDPQIFEVNWITELFSLHQVEYFILNYLGDTELVNVTELLKQLPKVKYMRLEVGKVDYQVISEILLERFRAHKRKTILTIFMLNKNLIDEDELNSIYTIREVGNNLVEITTNF